MNILQSTLPAVDSPISRLMERSADYLTEGELLALVHKENIENALHTSRDLLSQHGSLKQLAHLNVNELMECEGIGLESACAIQAAIEIAKRLNRYVGESRLKICSPEDAAELFRPILAGKCQEEFHIAMLNTKNEVFRCEIIGKGGIDNCSVDHRVVFSVALRYRAAKIIVAHGHPSGDPTPSSQDISFTKALVQAGNMLGLKVLDHIIIGESTIERPKYWFSFIEDELI